MCAHWNRHVEAGTLDKHQRCVCFHAAIGRGSILLPLNFSAVPMKLALPSKQTLHMSARFVANNRKQIMRWSCAHDSFHIVVDWIVFGFFQKICRINSYGWHSGTQRKRPALNETKIISANFILYIIILVNLCCLLESFGARFGIPFVFLLVVILFTISSLETFLTVTNTS